MRRLRRSLGPSLMTAAVIGIALALPAGFMLLLDNVARLSGGWQGQTRVSVFLAQEAGPERLEQVARDLLARPDVAAVQTLTPEQALAEFRALSGLDDVLDLLEHNPLPPVVVAEPPPGLAGAELDALVAAVQARPGVDRVRLDREWVRRLQAFMALLERAAWVVTALLAMAVILVVGNTIRLDIENRRDEIVIAKLIGATDAFVRRPFLYSGLLYGLVGGVLAWLLVETGRGLLSTPAQDLSALYGGGFRIEGLGLTGGLGLAGCGALLGLLGSWLAVARHLAAIEPR